MEKLFYVKPGAEPERIKIKVEGAKRLRVNEAGELELETELGVVKFTKPIAYQHVDGKRVEVTVEYSIESENPLTSPLSKGGFSEFPSSANPQLFPPLAKRGEGGFDSELRNSQLTYSFVPGKYDKTRELIIDPLLASTFIGSSIYDCSSDIALDSSGNVYVTGFTTSTNYPTTSGAYDTSHNMR